MPLNQPRSGRRVRPLAARRLEGVEAETYVWSVDGFDDFPDGLPCWSVRGPAPVFVGETEGMGGQEAGEMTEVTDDLGLGGVNLGGGRVAGSNLISSYYQQLRSRTISV